MFSNKNMPKICQKFYCEKCDYSTCKKSSFNNHLASAKHNKAMDSNKNMPEICPDFICQKCNKIYKDNSGLWRHKKKCVYIEQTNSGYIEKQTNDTEELIKYLMKENSEFKQLLLEQNKKMLELAKNSQVTNNTTNHTNSHNKSFNLQFFLNETCKNAMNITDFVNSLQLQLSDLEKVGELGYIEGISNIIIKNLNALDVTLRPVHCTDKKRETMYVKDENKWEKEDTNNTKLHNMVRKVSNKNIDLISEFKELHPEWKKSTSKVSDQFDKIIIESMGGKGDNDYEKEEKIIKKISKAVFVDKII
jgi:hypothetical protein